MLSTLVGDFFPSSILQSLGNLVVIWSKLEEKMGETILSLGGIGDFEAARIIVESMDLRSKTVALKAICFLEMTEKDFSLCESWLNHIDADLRPHRNRLIHDKWENYLLDDDKVYDFASRITTKLQVIKKPPTGERVLITSEQKDETCLDIESLCSKINASM